MAIILKGGSGTGHTVAADNHPARCIGMVYMGTCRSEWKGREKWVPKVRLTFEFPDETIETDDGPKPAVLSRTYTANLTPKATLTKHLEAWRGKAFTREEIDGFDLSKVLGAPCMVQVVHASNDSGDTYAKIENVAKCPKGLKVAAAVNDLLEWSVVEGSPNDNVFMGFPEWMQEEIQHCQEWQNRRHQGDKATSQADAAGSDEDEDDIPF